MPARRFKAPLARREYSFSVLTHGREERFLLVSPRYYVEETETRVGYRRSRHIGANGHNGKRDKVDLVFLIYSLFVLCYLCHMILLFKSLTDTLILNQIKIKIWFACLLIRGEMLFHRTSLYPFFFFLLFLSQCVKQGSTNTKTWLGLVY